MLDLELRSDVPLSGLSTLGVGGPARHYARAVDRPSVQRALAWAAERGLPVFVMGGGSNVVFSDDGFPGLVLHVDLRGMETAEADGAVYLKAAAGEPWDALVEMAVTREWAGLECLSGIPGRVGATPIQNVGAYGQDVSETLVDVEVYDRHQDTFTVLSKEECRFGYRKSRFKGEDQGRYVILGVRYRLLPGGEPALRYPEVQRAVAERGLTRPTVADVRRVVVELRRRKSMVIDPDDPNRSSVGSFFMNPVVPEAVAEGVREQLRREGTAEDAARMPAFPTEDGRVKLSAAWLIERAGIRRGYRRGKVGVSTNHTLALVNCGGGSAREVVELAREVRARVLDRFGVTLVPEPVFVNLTLDTEAAEAAP